MRDWNTDKIIGTGLIFCLLVYIVGFFVTVYYTGITLPLDVATNIVTGLAGYMGRSLLEKNKTNDGKKADEKLKEEGDNNENIPKSRAYSAM